MGEVQVEEDGEIVWCMVGRMGEKSTILPAKSVRKWILD